ncbi:sensor histidine kinase [Chitinophaga sp. Cy-1792]|uniref:sensor histidine kinase n=1 Tax=Chitinophaga sp. Cy-1792 TaxID=2608339 RepID=UPI0014249CBD|nr:sensor histidine kinase [Chitinophaga sp. Cy-1792]
MPGAVQNNRLLNWIVSGAFDKFYTPKVRLVAHISVWVFLLIVHTTLVSITYDESFLLCVAFAIRNVATIAFAFYFIMYLVIPGLILRKHIVMGIIALLVPLFVFNVFNYLASAFVINEMAVKTPGLLAACKQTINDGLFTKEAFHRLVRGIWGVTTAVGPCIVVKLVLDTIRNITRRLRLEKDRLDLELSFLKAQLNPHFLFNTLNNIYMLSLKGAEQASDLILHLSEMMRYTLYDSDAPFVDLQYEVDFMRNYTELERVRHGSKANIVFECNDEDIKDQRVSPLLMFPFLENAFKYSHIGVDGKCHVVIKILASGPELEMSVWNSKSSMPSEPREIGGIGQANSRKRLELLYPGKYTLDIEDGPDKYAVTLSLNLN